MATRLSRLEYTQAQQRSRREDLTEPRAESAHYDRKSRHIVVNLKNGAVFAFPSALAQGLAGAAAEDLETIELSPAGEGLHWPLLDADFSLPELMRGVFGTEAWMRRLVRQSKKPAKASPSVRNRNPHRSAS